MTNTLDHTKVEFLKIQAKGYTIALMGGATESQLNTAEKHILQIAGEIESGQISTVEDAVRIADERIMAEFQRMDETVDA